MSSWRRVSRGARRAHDAELLGAVQRLVGSAEKWAVYRVPGEPELPDPAAAPGRRERWWRTHVAMVAEALLLTEPAADRQAVCRARDLLVTCAVARDRRAPDARMPDAGPLTALQTVQVVTAMLAEATDES